MTIEAVLLDIGGVVTQGDEALPGAVEAVRRLQDEGLPLRFLTNTTRTPRRKLLARLRGIGLEVEPGDLFMPAIAARRLLESEGLVPHLLIHPALEEDFEGLETSGAAKAVIVGDAGTGFTYESLNAAFRALEAGAAFIALARNRSFQDADESLSLDAGPFVAALEYAAGREATLLGKPAPGFFQAAMESLGVEADKAVMVGDDVESDVGGAQEAGLAGLLVRTGKYREGDEARIEPKPAAVLEDLAAAVAWILERR